MIKFIVGFVFGVVAALVFRSPAAVTGEAHEAVSTVQKAVEVASHERCKKEFLANTQCFMIKPARECGILLKSRCGADPAIPDQKGDK